MRSMIRFIFLAATAVASLATEGPPPAVDPPPLPVTADLLLREIRYDGRLSDTQAKFAVDIDAESSGKGEASLMLFEGDVALLPSKLPSGVRIIREGTQYRLVAEKPGKYRFRLDLVAKITRVEPWNRILFAGPAAGIAAVSAAVDASDVELQLLSGTPLESNPEDKSRVRGVLGGDRNVSLRWQSKAAEAARKALITCDTLAAVQVMPTVIKFTTEFRYDIVQGNLSRLSVILPASHALTRVEGPQIRDWQSTMDGDRQLLTVELIKPVEKSYCLKLFSEHTIETTPFTAQLSLPQPQGVDRETGLLTVTAEDTVVETESLSGLRQVNATDGALAAYRFYGRPVSLTVNLRRIEPVIDVASRVTARLEEARLLIFHSIALKVEKAGVYLLELSPLEDFVVTDVRGEGVEDWKARDGKLIVSFASRVLGERKLEVQLEQAQKTFPKQIGVSPLRVAGAIKQSSQIGATPAPGISLKTAELNGLREISINNLASRTDELLAYAADQPDWTLKLSTEKLAPRIIAEVFNLVTIGDGLLGGSATIRYAIINQGVQEFRLRLPASWKNVDFTGPNIRRKERIEAVPDADTNEVVWSIALQDKAWGGYTLVVTYDEQFDPHKATLALGGIHALEVERETGSLAIASAASLQLREAVATDPLRRIDESELAQTDRALITRSVLLAYRYGSGDAYRLSVEVTRFSEEKVLEAIADRTQLTTVVTEAGEMLTQATFMVKNNDKQFQRFTLPKGAKFWSAYVNGQPAKTETDGDAMLIPLPRQDNRDQAFAVEIVYAQKVASLKSLSPREIALAAPQTDVQTTFAEWELYVPATHQLARFGGNMSVARGTTYSLGDAWTEFMTAYREVWRNTKGLLVVLVVVGVIVALVISAVRRGWSGAITTLVVVAIGAVLAGMMLPSLAKAKSRAQRISAVNNLKQIGLAARIFASDNQGQLPLNFEQMRNELGTDKILIDPESGERFVYLGAGRKEEDAGDVIAYSPVDRNGRAVLFGDGSVAQMSTRQFEEAMQRGNRVASQAPTPQAGSTPPQMFATAPPGGVGGGAISAAVVNGTGTAAPGEIRAPMAQGIRPIRIDIPRTGQKFTFTKVLNVGDEALKLVALAVSSKVLNVFRSVLQVTVFVSGLILLWWQLHRTAAPSLIVTIASAMILGSVGHLLISTRLLGMALVLTLPVFVLALIAFAARRLWLRRHAAFPTNSTGAEPSPSPDGTAGMGPAVATIALMFFVASANAKELAPVDSALRAPQSAIDSISVLSATYTGTVHERVAQIEAVIQVSAAKAGETIALFHDDVAVEEFSATPVTVKLVRQGNSVSVRLPKKGEATLRVKFLVKLGGDVTKRHLVFAIPPALSSRLALTVDEPEAAVEFPTAVSYHSVASQQQTLVEAVMGAGERVELQWTPRVKRAAEIAATVFCRNATLVNFNDGVMSARSMLDYQVTQGELREARVRLPAGHRLLRVEGESIRTWQVKVGEASRLSASGRSTPIRGEAVSPGPTTVDNSNTSSASVDAAGRVPAFRGDGDILIVELIKGVSPNYRLIVETEKTIDKLPDNFAVETPHALEVKRETGFVALSSSDELGLTVDAAQGLQKVDAAEFLKIMAQEKPLTGAYQFLRPDFALNVRVEALQPQIEAILRNRVRIGTEQVHLSAQVAYTIKRAGVFSLRLALPKDFRLESVTGNEIAQWVEKTDGDNRVLEVTLKHRTLGGYALQVSLVKSQKEPARTMDITGVHPLDTAKLTGYLVVSTEAGIQAKSASFEGLTEVPVNTVPDGGAGLAYKFLISEPVPATSPWKLVVAIEVIESWVRAEVVNWLTLSESLASGRALVRFEIQNAPVKEFRLKIPAAFQNVEITGSNIRRRDQNGEQWRVELQNKVAGTHMLTVTWEQPWSVKGQGKEALFDAAGVEVLGVERETGALAVIAKSQLQISPKNVSAELIRTDVQELPAWAGRADDLTVLVYRYLRPGYKLSLAAQQFAQAEVLQALVDNARLTTVVAEDGQMMTELTLSLRNNGRQFLEITLPGGAQVWSAFVAGQAVKPSLRDGKLLLPLERAGDSAIAVELIYVSAEKFPRTKGAVEIASPALDVPVKNARWELYLPPDYAYGRFAGTMTREPDAAPVVRTFSALEYREAEQEKKKALEVSVSSSRDEVRRKLSGGKLEEASKAYDRARRSGLDAETDEFKVLAKDIREAQSSNLLKAQKEVFFNNAGFFRQDGAMPVQEPGVQLQLDDKAAQQQWDRLQKAQEVATTNVRPLRVNLPMRGLRHSFSQVLQTEVGKPMLVSFLASNSKATHWPVRIGLTLTVFTGLWWGVNLTLRSSLKYGAGR
jgi:type II secretory pathway pseudopilin PulG